MSAQEKLLTEPIPKHRLLREIYRHYIEYRNLVMSPEKHEFGRDEGAMDGVINHGYFIYNPDGTKKAKVNVTISFWDLHKGLKDLSPRKREAMFYNVILDQKQWVVAEKMGISTVSVGQYVDQACIQLAKSYFSEDTSEIIEPVENRE